jgi:hypothetical protein
LWAYGVRPGGCWTGIVPAFLQQAVERGSVKPDATFTTVEAFTIAVQNALIPAENAPRYVLMDLYGVPCRFRQRYQQGLLIPDDAMLLVATPRNYEWFCSLPMVITYQGKWMSGLPHEMADYPSAELLVASEEWLRFAA